MKKIFLIAVLVSFTFYVSAQSESQEPASDGPPKPLSDWTFFQIGFFPDIPKNCVDSNVYGLKLGAPMCSGKGRVFGLEPSILYSGTDYIIGIQLALFGPVICKQTQGIQTSWFGPAICDRVEGIHGSWPLCVSKEFYGIQGAAVCITKTGVGFQGAAVNYAEPFCGFQAGAVNIAESVDGVQLGVVNYTEKRGCQFGFINIIKDGWLPFSLVFNIYFD